MPKGDNNKGKPRRADMNNQLGTRKKNYRVALFLSYFIESQNATDAALKAGYSKKNAANQGNLLLKSPDIQTKLAAFRAKIIDSNVLSITKQQTRLEQIASVTIDDYIIDFDGLTVAFKPIQDWTPAMKMACSEICYDKFGRIKISLHGKNWAFDQIQKHLGFYEKDNSQKPTAAAGVVIMLPDNGRGKIVPLDENIF